MLFDATIMLQSLENAGALLHCSATFNQPSSDTDTEFQEINEHEFNSPHKSIGGGRHYTGARYEIDACPKKVTTHVKFEVAHAATPKTRLKWIRLAPQVKQFRQSAPSAYVEALDVLHGGCVCQLYHTEVEMSLTSVLDSREPILRASTRVQPTVVPSCYFQLLSMLYCMCRRCGG